MSEKESHPIRNGIIASVVGGVILSFWSPFRDAVVNAIVWLWSLLTGAWNYLWSTHEVYGWVVLLLVSVSIPTVIRSLNKILANKEPGYTELYTEDDLFGARWHWSYFNGAISNLWCLCPKCQTELVFSEDIPDPFRFREADRSPMTNFICEKCRVTWVALEGKKSYALGTVEREIRRKIRTGEWQSQQCSA